ICRPYVTWPSWSSRNTSRRTVPSGTTRRSISWSIVVRTASLTRRNSGYSPVGSNSRRTGRTCRMLIRRTHRSSSRRCFRKARFRSNVFLVSPSRPTTKFSPGKRMGIPLPPRSLPTAFTMRTASRQPSASMLRLFASVTRGSADSRPNDNELPEDASHFAEFRLAVHRLDAEGAPFVDVPHAALRRVELDRERLREIGMVADHLGAEERPAVPLLHRLVAVRPLGRHQIVIYRRIEGAERDPVEWLDQGFVIVPEPLERAAAEPSAVEGAFVGARLRLA